MRITLSLIAAVAACAIFATIAHFSFVYDDILQIVNNPRLNAWSSVPGYFTQPLWAHLQGNGAYYRPMFLIWLRVNHALFGLQPGAWHIATGLAHVLACMLTFCLIRTWIPEDRAAFLAVLLFAFHPANAEVIAWVSAADVSLATAFVILSVLLYDRAQRATAGSVLSAGVAVLMHELGCIVLVLVVACAWARQRLSARWTHIVPYAFVVAAYFAARWYAIQSGGFQNSMTYGTMVLTWPRLAFLYLRHLLWPLRLSAFYEVPIGGGLLELLALLAAAATLIWLLPRLEPAARFGVAWILITLAPAFLIRSMHAGDFFHDRYLYLPMVGVAITFATVLARSMRFRRWCPLLIFPLLITLFGNITIWRDNITLFRRGLVSAPHNTEVKNNLGAALIGTANESEGVSLLEQATRENPMLPMPYINLGWYYEMHHDYRNAEAYYAAADRLESTVDTRTRLARVKEHQ